MLQSMTPPELQPLVSSRLLLRRLEESDLDALCAFMGDIEVMYAGIRLHARGRVLLD